MGRYILRKIKFLKNSKSWYKNLTKEEIELAESYDAEILALINNLPKGATEEQQLESYKKQKLIFEEKLQPLRTLSYSRRAGITPEEYNARIEKIKNRAKITVKQKITFVLLLAILTMVFVSSLL